MTLIYVHSIIANELDAYKYLTRVQHIPNIEADMIGVFPGEMEKRFI